MIESCSHCKNPKIRIKEHDTWIGWFCPNCKSGGSIQKRRTYKHQRSNFKAAKEYDVITPFESFRFDEPA